MFDLFYKRACKNILRTKITSKRERERDS